MTRLITGTVTAIATHVSDIDGLREHPHVEVHVDREALAHMQLGQVFHLVPAEDIDGWRLELRRHDLIEIDARLEHLDREVNSELERVRDLVINAIDHEDQNS